LHYGCPRKCPIKYPPTPSSLRVDMELSRIDHERMELRAEFERRMTRLDKRERSLLGLKD
jgi:hypothetical protein